MNGREMTRAERFEDEKKRIIESCFTKRDDDGSSKISHPAAELHGEAHRHSSEFTNT